MILKHDPMFPIKKKIIKKIKKKESMIHAKSNLVLLIIDHVNRGSWNLRQHSKEV